MRLSLFKPVAIATILVLLLAITGSAQERFGEITGMVSDASGARVPDASVTAMHHESGQVTRTKSGAEGTYFLYSLAPGRYTVKVEMTGFKALEVPDVNLMVGKRLQVNAVMQLGQTTETLQVTEQSPLIDFSRTMIANAVTSEEFDRMPKARSFQQLAVALPSVNSGEIEGGIQINGASGAENQYNIDGVSTTSLINGKSRQNAVFETLAEVQVKTTGIDAEYGGALGGVISAVTKSGSNAFHGDLHYYLTSVGLSASPNIRLLMDPATEKTVSFVQDDKSKTSNTNHEIGGSLSGYLIQDKLLFFTLFSPRFRNATREYGFSTGRENGSLSTDEAYHTFFQKLTWNPISKVRANFTYLWTPTKSLGRLPAYSAGPNQSVSTLVGAEPNKNIGFFAPQSSYTAQVDYTPSATTIVTAKAGRFWDNYKTTGIPGVSAVEWGNSSTNLPFTIPANLKQSSGYANTPRQLNTFHDLTTRTYGQLDVTRYMKFLGEHNLKGGFGTTHIVNNVDQTYPGGGYVRIFWDSAFTSPTLGSQRGTYGYYEANDFGTQGTTGAALNHFYIQDNWRILPRLTLSLGLRTENEKVPSFQRQIKDFAFEFTYADKLAPRLGASLDVFGDGKLKLYGSFGRYFDWVKYELSRGTFGGQLWKIKYRSLDTLDVLSLSGTNTPGRNIWAADPSSVRDRRIPAFNLIDPEVKPMSQDQLSGGMEYQLQPALVLRVSYVHNNLNRTIEDLGALDDQGNEVYLYANPGEGAAVLQPTSGATKPFPMPKAKRQYDALEFVVNRRFARSYFFSASYVYSRLYGNYAGLANSDEITSPSTGLGSRSDQSSSTSISRQGGNANRSWDIDEVLFDSHGNVNVLGRLATDRPNVFKLYGAKEFDWGGKAGKTVIGLNFYGGSGTPLSTYVNTVNQTQVFVEGRGNMGRTPFLSYTDMNLSHDFTVAEKKTMRLEFTMLNLFNQKTARNTFNQLNRGAEAARSTSAIGLSNVDLFKGYDYRALINAKGPGDPTGTAYDPRYGMNDIFNPGFTARLGLKFMF